MRRLLLLCLALFLLAPLTAVAEEEKPDYRWSLGWDSGIELRRLIGHDWDVVLGAGPNDHSDDSEVWRYSDEIG